ncbi:MAG: hypothetical protein KDD63_28595, partial [Bacteroidetes bacterium]|nr:hypothetical protein [Bacteroidota bacterium]
IGCPITKIQIGNSNPDEINYGNVELNAGDGKKIFFTSTNVANPLIDTSARNGNACLNPDDRDLNGRSNYQFVAKNAIDCVEDKRYDKYSPSEGEKTFFDLNNVEYLRLPAFYVSDSDRYHMFTRQLISWSPKCHDLIESLYDLQTDVYWFQKRIKTLATFTMVILIVNFVMTICDASMCAEGKKSSSVTAQKNIIIPVRNILVVIAVILQIGCFVKAMSMRGIFKKIGDEKCSDDYTNNFFISLEDDLRKYLVTFQIVSTILYILGCCLEIILTIACHCPKAFQGLGSFCKKRIENQTKFETAQLEKRKTIINPINIPIKQPVVNNFSLRNRNKNNTYVNPNPNPNQLPSSKYQPYNPNMAVPTGPGLQPPMAPNNQAPKPGFIAQPLIVQ